MAICAALYAVGSLATSVIRSPLGTGQFRPAVLIPGVFAVIVGPIPAGVGAALGTLIADSVSHGEFYIKSLAVAVPGNFIGFYTMGKLLENKFSWRRFIVVSEFTLFLANLIVATLYIPFYALFDPLRLSAQAAPYWFAFVLSLTLWWFVGMLPFMLLLGPPIIKAVCKAAPGITPEQVTKSGIQEEFPQSGFAYSLAAPGVIFLVIGLLTVIDPINNALLTIIKDSLVLGLIRILLLAGGGVLTTLGGILAASSTFRKQPKVDAKA